MNDEELVGRKCFQNKYYSSYVSSRDEINYPYSNVCSSLPNLNAYDQSYRDISIRNRICDQKRNGPWPIPLLIAYSVTD